MGDGSISGFISGSPNYDDGEIITTSKIKTTGVIDGGSIVQTVSGSRYYLDPKVPKSNIGLFNRNKKPTTSTTTTKKKETKTIPISRTTSLFSTKSITKQPPKGIPKFINWKKNRDNSITGYISGSSNFPDGDRVSTSPINSGNIKSGEIVQTSSGSKYYLV